MTLEDFLALLVVLLIFVGMVVLQVFLSRQKSAVLGLLLPGLFFIAILAFTLLRFTNSPADTGVTAAGYLFPLAVGNIPTAVLLLLYTCVRKARKSEKMDATKTIDLQNLE